VSPNSTDRSPDASYLWRHWPGTTLASCLGPLWLHHDPHRDGPPCWRHMNHASLQGADRPQRSVTFVVIGTRHRLRSYPGSLRDNNAGISASAGTRIRKGRRGKGFSWRRRRLVRPVVRLPAGPFSVSITDEMRAPRSLGRTLPGQAAETTRPRGGGRERLTRLACGHVAPSAPAWSCLPTVLRRSKSRVVPHGRHGDSPQGDAGRLSGPPRGHVDIWPLLSASGHTSEGLSLTRFRFKALQGC